jgi:hypothetical protein
MQNNKKIIYKFGINGVAVVYPSPTWKSSLEELATKDVPTNTPYKIVDSQALPQDYNFRTAWIWNDTTGIEICIVKAKDIWLEHYRRARTPLIEKLDIDFMRAVESSNTTLQKEIAAKKQALRDVTKTELPNTLDGIKATWPEILGEKPF